MSDSNGVADRRQLQQAIAQKVGEVRALERRRHSAEAELRRLKARLATIDDRGSTGVTDVAGSKDGIPQTSSEKSRFSAPCSAGGRTSFRCCGPTGIAGAKDMRPLRYRPHRDTEAPRRTSAHHPHATGTRAPCRPSEVLGRRACLFSPAHRAGDRVRVRRRRRSAHPADLPRTHARRAAQRAYSG